MTHLPPAFADRVAPLRAEGAYAVQARARALEAQGRHVLHLEIGQPDFETFAHIRTAGIHAIEQGDTRYTDPAGTPALRQAVAAYTSRRLGAEVSPARVVIAPGAKPGLFFPTLALVQPGDEVLLPDPGFPTYEAMVRLAGGTPISVPLLESEQFSFDLQAFDRLLTERTRLVVLNSPANPTGGVMPPSALEHIAGRARERGFWVLSDEIYARLVYDGGQAPSIAALPGMSARSVICDGFSKTYAMTGWRLGWMVMPEALAQRVALLLTHSIGCTASFTQAAGVQALEGPQEGVAEVVAEYQRRRDALVAGLNAIPGITCQVPQGAFYAFPNVRSFGLTSQQVADRLLEEAGVALLAGTDFGAGGEGYLRLCYATSMEVIEAALVRMKAWFGAL